MSLLEFDTLARKVLLAVELVDPATGQRIYDGIKVAAADAAGGPLPEPILNASGRFVWRQPNMVATVTVWPARLRIEPRHELPYATREIPLPPPATNPAVAHDGTSATLPRNRLISVVLWPTAAYPFENVTAVRGVLREAGDGSEPVENAVVQLATFVSDAWRPIGQGLEPPATALASITDRKGQFGVVLPDPPSPLRSQPAPPALVRVRLQVTRRVGDDVQVRWTSDAVGELPVAGIPRGRILTPAQPIRWDRLTDQ